MVKLGEVADLQSGYTPSKDDLRTSGNYPYFKVGEMNLIENSVYLQKTSQYINNPRKIYKRGSVVFPRNGGAVYTEKKRILLKDSVIDLNTGAIIPNEKIVYNRYLYMWSCYEKFSKYDNGGGLPSLNFKKMINIEIPLPPLEEQHRIVGILDAAFAKIDALKANAKANLANAKALFQQVLAQELKPKEGCEMAKLGDVCELKSGNSSANDSNDGHLAYVKVSDLNLEENKNCIVTSTKFVDRQQNLKNIFPVGSVIFPKRGGAILTNKKRLTSIEVCCDLNIMGVIPCTNLDSHYLFYYFQGLNLGKISSGTTIPQINNKDVSPLLIPLPVIDEQHRIVRTLDTLSEKCRRLEQVAQQTIRECDALKQSILRQAFSGEL